MSQFTFSGKSIFTWRRLAAHSHVVKSSSPIFQRIITEKETWQSQSRQIFLSTVRQQVHTACRQAEMCPQDDEALINSVVKVYCARAPPKYSAPWQEGDRDHSNSSAFMIGERMLLTNAHCVRHHIHVEAQRIGNGRYPAKVLAEGIDCDLALLSVECEEFWKEAVQPLKFGGLPHLKEKVTVVGYPVGGDSVSLTRGIVSRIELMDYGVEWNRLLGIQIDAALNPGNSGGPALNDRGECVGVAFMLRNDCQSIGYLVPTPVISHFLDDYKKNGKYTGFPWLGLRLQKLTNPALRRYLKVPFDEGVLVRRVTGPEELEKVLKKGDVITSIDGVRIDNEQTVPVPFGVMKRIDFQYLISQKFVGEEAQFGILRKGRFMKVPVVLKAKKRPAFYCNDSPISYLIVGGLVFTKESEPQITRDEGDEACSRAGCHALSSSQDRTLIAAGPHSSSPKFEDKEAVILRQVYQHEVNFGYAQEFDLLDYEVKKFNGTTVKNIRHLAHLVDSCKDEYLVFELELEYTVTLEREAAAASLPAILKYHRVPAERSADLMEPYEDSEPDDKAADLELDSDSGDSSSIDSSNLESEKSLEFEDSSSPDSSGSDSQDRSDSSSSSKESPDPSLEDENDDGTVFCV